MTRILLLGLDPDAVDFSDPALPPGMTAEKVRAGIAIALKRFTDRGWESDGSGTSVTFDELRLCGHRSGRASAAPQPCATRSRHQRDS